MNRTATEFVFGSVRQMSAMFGTVRFGSDVREQGYVQPLQVLHIIFFKKRYMFFQSNPTLGIQNNILTQVFSIDPVAL